MTNKLLPDMLFPGHVWLYRRLKIYVWAALGTASAFLFVTSWIAKAASEGELYSESSSRLSVACCWGSWRFICW